MEGFKKGLVIVLVVSLSGCSAEMIRKGQIIQLQRLKAEAEMYCTTFGFTPATVEFKQCTLLRAGQLEEQRAETGRAIGQALMLNQSRRTNCYTFGNSTSCNSY
jgi:hypothetical protein